MCFGCSKELSYETVLLKTHNICFGFRNKRPVSGGLYELHHVKRSFNRLEHAMLSFACSDQAIYLLTISSSCNFNHLNPTNLFFMH